jgi:hypothetical protein
MYRGRRNRTPGARNSEKAVCGRRLRGKRILAF